MDNPVVEPSVHYVCTNIMEMSRAAFTLLRGIGMRLKLTLKRRGAPVRDIRVTADVTATIGDIARFLSVADPAATNAVPPDGTSRSDVTLRVENPGALHGRLLNPLLSIHESGLRSGCAIELVPTTANRPGEALSGHPVAAVRVITGPDSGARFTIAAGVNFIGRHPDAEVRLTDPLVSRRHANIAVAESVTITDLNSANGVEIDGVAIDRASVTTRSRIRIGESVLGLEALAFVGGPSPNSPFGQTTQVPVTRDESSFSRSPRVESTYPGEQIVLPDLPTLTEKTRFPILAVVAPIVMGATMFAVTRQMMSLVFIAMSPLIMLGTWVDNRTQNARKERDQAGRFANSIEAARASLTSEQGRQRDARVAESPGIPDVIAAIAARSELLWTRKPEHATFLEVRFGLGDLPSRTSAILPSRGSAAAGDWSRVTDLAGRFTSIADVPVVENLERAGAIGIAGAPTAAGDAARSVVMQLAGLHSPADLVFCAFSAGQPKEEWSWLAWLPHVDSPYSPVAHGGLAGDPSSAAALMADLEGLIERRRSAGAGRGETVRSRIDEKDQAGADHGKPVDRLPATPVLVAIVTDDAPADRARLVAIAQSGPDYGVFTIWLASDRSSLPVVCRTYLEVEQSGRAHVGFVRTGRRIQLGAIDRLDSVEAVQSARQLAPIDDTGAQVLDESDLPRRVAFVELLDERVASDAEVVLQRWRRNDSLKAGWTLGDQREPGGLRALVGQGALAPFQLDLRGHGPHALVAGTTGSGKSEFLQTWLLGLATEYSPDRVTFLLVDYKGGSAFADCVDLPHTVGLVTDLTPRLVRRALTSLRAEVRHRETVLSSKGAKDLEELERRSDPDAPPALILVIDEFAALASEVPDFIDGVVDIAQRGRSLGLHLVMATQRPAGVITESLRANTNLRIALRVADEADSIDVLGDRAAAHFDPATPGRAAAKLGPGRAIDFQAAYVGGRTDESESGVDIEVHEMAFGQGAEWTLQPQQKQADAAQARDIARIVQTIAHAGDRSGVDFPRRPWLDELPSLIDIDELPGADAGSIPIGLVDEPDRQRQLVFALRPDEFGNVAVIGTSGCGKTTFLRSIAYSASRAARQHPIWIYGLDFGGGGLGLMESLPTVGSVIRGDDTERVTRLISDLWSRSQERAARFARARASDLLEYRRITGRSEPRILVLIDGMAAFRTDFEFRESGAIFETFLKLAATGRQVGIAFVVTTDRASALPSALLANIQQQIVLRLASESEYSMAGVAADALDDAPVGKAVIGGREAQLAVPAGTGDVLAQTDRIEALVRRIDDVEQAPEIMRLPEIVPVEDLPSELDGCPVLGLGSSALEPVAVPLDGFFVVSGPFASGRTNAMRTLIRNLRSTRPNARFYLLSARRSDLEQAAEWHATACEAEKVEALVRELTRRLTERSGTDGPEAVIVVEGVADFEGVPADSAVAGLIKLARRVAVPVLAETDVVKGAGAWSIHSELKTARAGIVLQPDESDGFALFRVQFPRVTRAEFPVGRGLLVRDGLVERIQVAFAGGDAAQGQNPLFP